MPTIEPGVAKIDRAMLTVVVVLLPGASVALLDTTVVALAIDDLTHAFGTTIHATQWVTTAYLLAMAAVIPTMGWLTSRWGARRIWQASLALFLCGSALCALAWSVESLVAFRVVQGTGGGLILPLVQTVVAGEAGPHRIGRAMSLVGIPGQLAPILGPVVGGIVLGSLGWRWIFLVNLPICLIALVLAHRHLHPREVRTRTGFDWIGALLVLPATVALLAGLSTLGDTPAAPVIPVVLLTGGAVLLAGYVPYGRRRGGGALLDVRLLRRRSFSVATVMLFLSGACLYGPMLLLPLFYQQVRGIAAGDVGWLLAPQGIGLMVALSVAGRTADRIGPRTVALTGVALAAAGLSVFVVAGEASLLVLSSGLAVLGAGLGSVGVAVSATSYRDLGPADVPNATSMLNVVQRIGASVGTVVTARVLDRQLATAPTDGDGLSSAFAHALAWTLALLGVAMLVVTLLPTTPPPSTHTPDHERSTTP